MSKQEALSSILHNLPLLSDKVVADIAELMRTLATPTTVNLTHEQKQVIDQSFLDFQEGRALPFQQAMNEIRADLGLSK